MSMPALMRHPARPCATLRKTGRTTVLVEAAGIEPAPQVGLTADEPGRWLSGEDGQKAPTGATAMSRANRGGR